MRRPAVNAHFLPAAPGPKSRCFPVLDGLCVQGCAGRLAPCAPGGLFGDRPARASPRLHRMDRRGIPMQRGFLPHVFTGASHLRRRALSPGRPYVRSCAGASSEKARRLRIPPPRQLFSAAAPLSGEAQRQPCLIALPPPLCSLLRQFPQGSIILDGRIAQNVIQLVLRSIGLAYMVADGPGAFFQQEMPPDENLVEVLKWMEEVSPQTSAQRLPSPAEKD